MEMFYDDISKTMTADKMPLHGNNRRYGGKGMKGGRSYSFLKGQIHRESGPDVANNFFRKIEINKFCGRRIVRTHIKTFTKNEKNKTVTKSSQD